jgi:UDP-N-acetylglucosamine 2-epimerase (non-hydrolysing)
MSSSPGIIFTVRSSRAPRVHPVARPRDGRQAVLVVAGTRPECIKVAPVVWALRSHPRLRPVVVNSGQHPLAVRRTFTEFGIECDYALEALPQMSHLAASCVHLQDELVEVMKRTRPAIVLVQGDTLTTFAAARASRRLGLTTAHIEAGLRTDSVGDPFPEEWFRRRIAQLADLHFAPSEGAARNLYDEGVPSHAVHVTGNTGIDTLAATLRELPPAPRSRDLVLVTLHRRENCDPNADALCRALLALARERPSTRMVLPVHPNPRIAQTIRRRLEHHASIALVEPMRYREFIAHAARSALIISDSGGIQEEAPHLGTPLLVPRSNTERPEALATGFVRLVPTEPGALVREACGMLDAAPRSALPIDEHAPYGAGEAAKRLVALVQHSLQAVAVA